MKTRSREYRATEPKEPKKPLQQKVQDSTNDSINEKDLKDKLNVLYTDITSKPSYSAKIAEFLRQHDVHGVNRRIVKQTFPLIRVIARFLFDVFMNRQKNSKIIWKSKIALQ